MRFTAETSESCYKDSISTYAFSQHHLNRYLPLGKGNLRCSFHSLLVLLYSEGTEQQQFLHTQVMERGRQSTGVQEVCERRE